MRALIHGVLLAGLLFGVLLFLSGAQRRPNTPVPTSSSLTYDEILKACPDHRWKVGYGGPPRVDCKDGRVYLWNYEKEQWEKQ